MFLMTLLSLRSFGCKSKPSNIDHKLYMQHMVKLLITNCKKKFLFSIYTLRYQTIIETHWMTKAKNMEEMWLIGYLFDQIGQKTHQLW